MVKIFRCVSVSLLIYRSVALLEQSEISVHANTNCNCKNKSKNYTATAVAKNDAVVSVNEIEMPNKKEQWRRQVWNSLQTRIWMNIARAKRESALNPLINFRIDLIDGIKLKQNNDIDWRFHPFFLFLFFFKCLIFGVEIPAVISLMRAHEPF